MEGKLEGKKYRLIVEPIEQEGQTPPKSVMISEARTPVTAL